MQCNVTLDHSADPPSAVDLVCLAVVHAFMAAACSLPLFEPPSLARLPTLIRVITPPIHPHSNPIPSDPHKKTRGKEGEQPHKLICCVRGFDGLQGTDGQVVGVSPSQIPSED